jgi:hypothetical protein
MVGFFRKLFKRRDDVPPHLREYCAKIANFPPDVGAGFAIKPQSDTIPNASGRFGYEKSNPIPVCLQEGELDYLARLRCECGEPFAFHRMGSFGQGPDGHAVDGYELICGNRQHRITLYLDMYHAGPSSLVPDGLEVGHPNGIGLPFRVDNFPEGLPQAIDAAIKSKQR